MTCITRRKIEGDKFEFGIAKKREVRRLISEVDVSKDSCIDGISTKVLKVAFLKKTCWYP